MKKVNYLHVVLILIFVLSTAFVAKDGWVVPDKYKTMKNPQAGVEDDDEIGLDLWEEHCASCHGRYGAGDGNKADDLEAELNDFSEDIVQDQSDGAIYYKSFIGKDEMPNFEKKITDEEERWLLVNYIRTLGE